MDTTQLEPSLNYITQIFDSLVLFVRTDSNFKLVPILIHIIKQKAPEIKLHLVLWQIQTRIADFSLACSPTILAQIQQQWLIAKQVLQKSLMAGSAGRALSASNSNSSFLAHKKALF